MDFKQDTDDKHGILIQTRNSCTVFVQPEQRGDTASCGIGTNRTSSTTKKYLQQFNVKDSNTTVWYCGFNYIFSNNFTLQVKDKVHVNSAAEPPITDHFTLPIVFTVAQLVIGALSTFL